MNKNIAVLITMDIPDSVRKLKPDLPNTLFYERKGLIHVNEKLFDKINSNHIADVQVVRFKKDSHVYRSFNDSLAQIARQEIIINPVILQWIFDSIIEINMRGKFSSYEDKLADLRRDLDIQKNLVSEYEKDINFLTFQCTKMGKYIRISSKETPEKEALFKDLEKKNENLHDAIESEVQQYEMLDDEEKKKEKDTVKEEAILAKTDLVEKNKKAKKKPEMCLLHSKIISGYMDDMPVYAWRVMQANQLDYAVINQWSIYRDKLNTKKVDLLLNIIQAVNLLSEDSMNKLLVSLDA